LWNFLYEMAMSKEKRERVTLKTIRRVWSVFFVTLFLFFLFSADFSRMKGYQVGLFLQADPLVWLAGLLTGWTVYTGVALALFIIAPTLFLGRFYCSWICPLGIMNQWIYRLMPGRKPVEDYSMNEYRPLYRLKYYILAALLVLAAMGSLQIGLFDPIALIHRSFIISVLPATDMGMGAIYQRPQLFLGGVLIGLLFIALILANRQYPRFWCRTLCPLGALLGVMSLGSVYRIRRDVDKCTDCNKCLRGCQGACDPQGALRIAECHVCMNCIDDCPEDALTFGPPESRSSIHAPLDVNRRRMMETVVAAAVLYPMMKSSLTGETTAQAAVIRPPGSLAEPDFLRRCIKCAMCMRACPTNVLQPALLEAGFEGLWTPVLINQIGWCESHCVMCGQVCPTGAIMPLTVQQRAGTPGKPPPMKLGTAFYDRGRCLPWAMNVECIVCEEVCPTSPKAIWFEVKEIKNRDGSTRKLKMPYVDPKLCIGCGICENKCPVQDKAAIRVTSVGETRSKTNKMLLGSR